MLDTVLFAAFPYVAVVLAVVGGIVRYFTDRFSFSSHSSQFLENRVLFWGSVSWHYGIIFVLLAHIGALAFSGCGSRSATAGAPTGTCTRRRRGSGRCSSSSPKSTR